MAHYSRIAKVVMDVPPAEHEQELEFWKGASGLPMPQGRKYPEYHGADLPGQQFELLIQRLGDGPARIHLDVHTDDLEAEVTRLERLGAQRIEQVESWWVMRDPAGLTFCVIPEEPGVLDEDNAQRWD